MAGADHETQWLKGRGEMAREIRERDWKDSALGPIAGWSQTLRAAVDLMLASGHAMQLAWGPELIMLYNDAYAPMLEQRHPAALGKPLSEAWPDVWEEIAPLVERVFAGETISFEEMPLTMTRKGFAEKTWWSFSFSPVRDTAGEIAGLLNVTLDVSPRVRAERAEAALKVSERQMRHVLDGMTESFGLLDQDLRIIMQNDAALRMDGRRLEEVVGLTHAEAFPGADERLEQLYREVLDQGHPVQLERRHVWDNGTTTWLDMRAYPVPEGLAVFWRDITERKEAEAALRESEARHRLLIESWAQAVWESDADGMMVKDSFSWRAYTGQTLDEWLGYGWLDAVHPEDRAYAERQWCEAIATRVLVDAEFRLRAPGGGWRWTNFRAAPVRRDDGSIEKWVGLNIDIDARKRAEADLRSSESRLQAAISISTVGILFCDDEGRIVDTNGAFLRMSGFAPEELEGKSWRDLTPPEFHERSEAFLEELRETGEGSPYEKQYLRADGSRCWGQFAARKLEDGFAEFVVDITATREALARLEASEERLMSVVEIGRLGLWDWDIVTGRVHWSEEHYRMLGLPVSGTEPSYSLWAEALHPDDRTDTERLLADAMAEQREFNSEFRVIHPDGAVRWLNGRGRFVYDNQGRAVRMIGAVVDTTERRDWAERQEVLIRELQHRTFNLLGMVRSVAEGTLASSRDLAEFRRRFGDRIAALARVQRHLSRLGPNQRITFDELIEGELEAIGALPPNPARLRLSGPRGVALRSASVQIFAMALHELVTNALKHGALGQENAHLAITWELRMDEKDRPWLHLDWRESGVAMEKKKDPPPGTGQGRALIEEALPFQMNARTTLVFEADGVHCTIAMPVAMPSATS